MKIATILLALSSTAFGAFHTMCGCQTNSGSPTFVDSATQTCCTFGVVRQATSGVPFPGQFYCVNPGKTINGDNFNACCRQNGAGDSSCSAN